MLGNWISRGMRSLVTHQNNLYFSLLLLSNIIYPFHSSAAHPLDKTALRDAEHGSTLAPKHKSCLSSARVWGLHATTYLCSLLKQQLGRTNPHLLHLTTASLTPGSHLVLAPAHLPVAEGAELSHAILPIAPKAGKPQCCLVDTTYTPDLSNRDHLLCLHVWDQGKRLRSC